MARIRLGFDPGGIAVGGGSVWVTNPSGGAVARIDPRSNGIVGSTRVGRDPVAIAFGDGAVWVANYEDGTVSRIDPRNGADVARIAVGPYPGDACDRRGRSVGRGQGRLEHRGELVPALLEAGPPLIGQEFQLAIRQARRVNGPPSRNCPLRTTMSPNGPM